MISQRELKLNTVFKTCSHRVQQCNVSIALVELTGKISANISENILYDQSDYILCMFREFTLQIMENPNYRL